MRAAFLCALLLGTLLVFAGVPAHSAALPKSDPQTLKLIDAAIAGDHRSDKNKARDAYRHPREALEFFGLRKDMTIVEIWPGGGWYSEILAPVVKDHGRYIAALPPPKSADAEDVASVKALKQKFAARPDLFGKAEFTHFGSDALELAPPASVDMIFTFRNIHNWMDGGWAEKAFPAMFKALKPGGILALEEHRGNTAVPQDPKANSGYVNQDYAIKMIEAAGFKLAGSSEISANPKDDKNHEKGVWTLPPTLELGDKDRAKYLAIGESDRFTLKFQKPR